MYGGNGDSFPECLLSEERAHVTLNHRPARQDRLPSTDAPDLPLPECQDVLAALWDYLDGNCSEQLVERIELHVAACDVCLRFTQVQQQLLASLAELRERVGAPGHVHDRVRRALATEQRDARRISGNRLARRTVYP